MYNEKFGEERVKMMMPRMTEAFAKVRTNKIKITKKQNTPKYFPGWYQVQHRR
jgi:hypothetical protein